MTGAYTLDMSTDLQSAPVDMQNSGNLASGDSTFTDGEYYDAYTFEGQPGQSVTIDLNSSDFDTYLVLKLPMASKKATTMPTTPRIASLSPRCRSSAPIPST